MIKTNKNEEKSVEMSSYFTIKPKKDEVAYIRFKYEEARRKRMARGVAPLSLSRFLTRMILKAIDDGGPTNG